MNKQKERPLTVKQRKFVNAIVQGKPKSHAYREAGYKASTDQIARTEGSQLSTKPNIQRAIDEALEKQGLNPDFAVTKIGNVANMELTHQSAPSILKASNTILELHGWNKNEKASMQVNFNQFFGKFNSKE